MRVDTMNSTEEASVEEDFGKENGRKTVLSEPKKESGRNTRRDRTNNRIPRVENRSNPKEAGSLGQRRIKKPERMAAERIDAPEKKSQPLPGRGRRPKTVRTEKNGLEQGMELLTLDSVPAKKELPKRNNENKEKKPALRIIPLGGMEQIGMNITAFEYGDSIIVVDCGLAFPEDDMLGIDLVIPDVTYLKENADKVKGFVITHGHEDHIGALPYVLKQLNVPIYATKLTLGIIENKLKEHNLMKSTKRKVIRHGQ